MYKIVYKNIIIDILRKPIYCMYIPETQTKVRSDIMSANCIISSNGNETYHLLGRSPVMPDEYKSVELISINAEEYKYLESLKTEDKPLAYNLADIRARKIAEVSAASEAIIHAGTDVRLTDHETYHFSFSDQDQFQIGFLATTARNASILENLGVPTGETGKDYPWHADGGDCVFYSREDIIRIGTAMQNYITYHNSYFHALRNYINALTSPLFIADLSYGAEVPKRYWGEVYDYANS